MSHSGVESSAGQETRKGKAKSFPLVIHAGKRRSNVLVNIHAPIAHVENWSVHSQR